MDRIDVINSSILKMIDCDIRCTLLYFTVLRSTVSHFLNLFFSLHFCISLCRIVSTVQTIMYNIIRAAQYHTCCTISYVLCSTIFYLTVLVICPRCYSKCNSYRFIISYHINEMQFDRSIFFPSRGKRLYVSE